jgi:hypothetical protein
MNSAKCGGFTLFEVMIVTLIFLPILWAISMTTGMVSGTINANDQSAEVLESLRRSAQRVAQVIRPASMTTIRCQAIQADVDAGICASVGEWIEPTDLQPRPGIRFQSSDGVMSMNASALTSPREIFFVMEAGEVDNDLDDDGDGKVDEGTLHLLYDTATVTLVDDIEFCSFAMDGRLLRMQLQSVRIDAEGRAYRATLQQTFYLRNN